MRSEDREGECLVGTGWQGRSPPEMLRHVKGDRSFTLSKRELQLRVSDRARSRTCSASLKSRGS